MTINLLDIARRFQDLWIVLDRGLNVVDSGDDLQTLCRKHAGMRRTYYFVNAN